MGNSSSKKRLALRPRQVNTDRHRHSHPPSRASQMSYAQHHPVPAYTLAQIREDSGWNHEEGQKARTLTDMERMRIEAYGASAAVSPRPRPQSRITPLLTFTPQEIQAAYSQQHVVTVIRQPSGARPQLQSAPLPLVTYSGYHIHNHGPVMSVVRQPSDASPQFQSARLPLVTYPGYHTHNHGPAMAVFSQPSAARPLLQSAPLPMVPYGGRGYSHNDAMAMIRESSGAHL
ncbi:hypothetical protein EC968_004141 [Mortierella alpina]|nr:hypothetical protein EC968_004141 [Mortierella alpina]